MTFVPELLMPLESGFNLFGMAVPSLYGISNIIMAVFLILVIIFRRQGLLGSSEILLESWFSGSTYTSLFKKSEYQALGAAIRGKFTRKQK